MIDMITKDFIRKGLPPSYSYEANWNGQKIIFYTEDQDLIPPEGGYQLKIRLGDRNPELSDDEAQGILESFKKQMMIE